MQSQCHSVVMRLGYKDKAIFLIVSTEGFPSTSMTTRFPIVPLAFERLSQTESVTRAREFREEVEKRRSVRHFAPDPVPMEAIDECIRAAGSAPSGANRQPWTFVVVSDAKGERWAYLGSWAWSVWRAKLG